MPNPLIRKLEVFAALSRRDRKAIELLSAIAPRWRGGKYHLESRTPAQAAV